MAILFTHPVLLTLLPPVHPRTPSNFIRQGSLPLSRSGLSQGLEQLTLLKEA